MHQVYCLYTWTSLQYAILMLFLFFCRCSQMVATFSRTRLSNWAQSAWPALWGSWTSSWPPASLRCSCPLTFTLKPGLPSCLVISVRCYLPTHIHLVASQLLSTTWCPSLSASCSLFSRSSLLERLYHRAVWPPGFGPLRFSIHRCSPYLGAHQ